MSTGRGIDLQGFELSTRGAVEAEADRIDALSE